MLQRSLLRVVKATEPRIGRVFASSLVSSFEKMVEDLPYREAVRYTKDNKKFTAGQFLFYYRHLEVMLSREWAGDVKKHADSLANGLLEFDFNAGDTIGVWLEEIIHKVRKLPKSSPPHLFRSI